jgi:hypothetical protein
MRMPYNFFDYNPHKTILSLFQSLQCFSLRSLRVFSCPSGQSGFVSFAVTVFFYREGR